MIKKTIFSIKKQNCCTPESLLPTTATSQQRPLSYPSPRRLLWRGSTVFCQDLLLILYKPRKLNCLRTLTWPPRRHVKRSIYSTGVPMLVFRRSSGFWWTKRWPDLKLIIHTFNSIMLNYYQFSSYFSHWSLSGESSAIFGNFQKIVRNEQMSFYSL